MTELNARQWRLYRLLRERGDTWTKQREIAEHLPEFYPIGEGRPFHDSAARLLMTRDIGEINESGVIQKIIISNKKGVKLANKEEAQQFIAGRYAAAVRSLARVRLLERKAGLDGQARLVFGKEREFISAFISGEREKKRQKPARISDNGGLLSVLLDTERVNL